MSNGSIQVLELNSVSDVFDLEKIPQYKAVDLADASIWVLPESRWGKLVFGTESVDAVKLAGKHSLVARFYATEENPSFAALESAEWILPTLFIQGLASVPYSMLSGYLLDLVRGWHSGGRVRSKIYVRDSDRTIRVEYDGPVGGYGEAVRQVLERKRDG